MKNCHHFNLIICKIKFFLILFIFSSFANDLAKKKEIFNVINKAKLNMPIRVLLDKTNCDIQKKYIIESDKGLIIIFPEDKNRIILEKTLEIDIKESKLLVNGKQYSHSSILILPNANFLQYQNNLFEGFFEFTKFKNNVFFVNHLELEDYVSIVLQSESWPGWPDEVNKALSVCIRSYGSAKILEHRKKKEVLPYDIKNSTMHQVYKGSKDPLKLKKVVKQTEGLVLSYNSHPILAMFDISCGGIIPSEISGYDFNKAPYLNRSYACTYCKEFKSYKWQNSFAYIDFERAIRNLIPNFNKLQDIRIYQKDQGGIVLTIKVKDTKGWHIVSGQDIKSIFNLKSLCFAITKNKKELIFNGFGFGHLVGLCQLGLRQMLRENSKLDYVSALKFYYPYTRLMKLTAKNIKLCALAFV